jgi:hypothetical protein
MQHAFLCARDDDVMRSRLALAIACTLAVLPVDAAVLYKSVDANGTVTFSDTPPSPDAARIVEQRAMDTYGSASTAAPGAASAGLEQVYGLIDSDEALAKANARVDMAEHALALARNGTAPRTEGLRLAASRITLADEARIEFYKRDLKLARRELVELLRSRQPAAH